MKRERMYVSPAFKTKLKKDAIDAGITLLQLTEDLAQDAKNIRKTNSRRKGIELKLFS